MGSDRHSRWYETLLPVRGRGIRLASQEEANHRPSFFPLHNTFTHPKPLRRSFACLSVVEMDTLRSALLSLQNSSSMPDSTSTTGVAPLDSTKVIVGLVAVALVLLYRYFTPKFHAGIPTDKKSAWTVLGHLPGLLKRIAGELVVLYLCLHRRRFCDILTRPPRPSA